MQFKRRIFVATIWSGVGWTVLAVALFLQLTPLFFLSLMIAYGAGLPPGGMLVIGPVMLFTTVFTASRWPPEGAAWRSR